MSSPSSVLTAKDIRFDAATHTYWLPDGRLCPGVTAILSETGVAVDFDALGDRSRTLRETIVRKRELGAALHKDAHALDDNDLVLETVHDDVRPYLEAWRVAREQLGLTPRARERLVFHPTFVYAGQMDGIFSTHHDGRLVLPDLKTGDCDDAGTQFQTAAYEAAYRVEHPELQDTAILRLGIQLTPDRAIPYRVFVYKDWRDFHKFQAFLTTYNEQAARRLRR